MQRAIGLPNTHHASLTRKLAIAFAASLLLAASAQIQVPLYPVPMTLQTLALGFIGMYLGPRWAVAAVALYLAEGLAGMPVFAGFKFGPAALMGPTGGFLFGFIPGVLAIGLLHRRGGNTVISAALALLVGHAVVFAVGVPWLAATIGWPAAVSAGLMPFIPGAIVKVAIGTAAAAMLSGRTGSSPR